MNRASADTGVNAVAKTTASLVITGTVPATFTFDLSNLNAALPNPVVQNTAHISAQVTNANQTVAIGMSSTKAIDMGNQSVISNGAAATSTVCTTSTITTPQTLSIAGLKTSVVTVNAGDAAGDVAAA